MLHPVSNLHLFYGQVLFQWIDVLHFVPLPPLGWPGFETHCGHQNRMLEQSHFTTQTNTRGECGRWAGTSGLGGPLVSLWKSLQQPPSPPASWAGTVGAVGSLRGCLSTKTASWDLDTVTWSPHLPWTFPGGSRNITATICGMQPPRSQGSSEASSFDLSFLDNTPLKPREEAK